MKDSNDLLIKNDSLDIINELVDQTNNSFLSENKILLILLFFVFIYLCFVLYNKLTIKYNITSHQIEPDNKEDDSLDTLFNKLRDQPLCEDLYKKLIRRSHPDLFPNDKNKIKSANEITSLLGKHKLELEKLKELEIRIQKELYEV